MNGSPRDKLALLARDAWVGAGVRAAAEALLRDLPPVAEVARVPDPAEAGRGRDLADQLVLRLGDETFPDDLTPLRGLDDVAVRELLDDLVGRLLGWPRSEAALQLAVRRVATVARATGGFAGMPAITHARREAVAVALSFVAADDLLAAVLAVDDEVALEAGLRALARSSRHVGRLETDVALRLGWDFQRLADALVDGLPWARGVSLQGEPTRLCRRTLSTRPTWIRHGRCAAPIRCWGRPPRWWSPRRSSWRSGSPRRTPPAAAPSLRGR
ncbi:hypothetical protein [Dactylosporangium cerinum]